MIAGMSEMYAAYLRRTKGSDAERAYWERAELDEVIAQLEAENAALREFVAAVDGVDFLMLTAEDGDRYHDAL